MARRRWEGTFPLDSSWNNSVERRENEGKKKRKKKRERKRKKKKKKRGVRSSTFSLGFTEIGPSVFVRARGKVYLSDESFM